MTNKSCVGYVLHFYISIRSFYILNPVFLIIQLLDVQESFLWSLDDIGSTRWNMVKQVSLLQDFSVPLRYHHILWINKMIYTQCIPNLVFLKNLPLPLFLTEHLVRRMCHTQNIGCNAQPYVKGSFGKDISAVLYRTRRIILKTHYHTPPCTHLSPALERAYKSGTCE